MCETSSCGVGSKIDRVTNNLIREGVPSIINPPDRHALEQALLLREQFGGSVTVLTMGAPDAKRNLARMYCNWSR